MSRIRLDIKNIRNIELSKIKNNKDAITFFESRLDFTDVTSSISYEEAINLLERTKKDYPWRNLDQAW